MTWPGPRYSMLAGSGQARPPCRPSAANLGDHHLRCGGRDIGYPPFRRRQQVRIALPPYRPAGCRSGSRPAARANRARTFRCRTAGPSRRGRAQLDAGNPCTKRSTGRGRRQRCRASSADRVRISRLTGDGEEIHERSTYIPKSREAGFMGNWRGEVLFFKRKYRLELV